MEFMKDRYEMDTLQKWNWLVENELFEDNELRLVCCGWGRNDDTFDTICQVRFAYDFVQLYNEVESDKLR